MKVFADIFKKALAKRRISVNIVSLVIFQRTINIANYAQDGVSLISEQGTVKRKWVFVSTSGLHKQNGFRVS